MTPTVKPVVERAPRKAYWKICEGWLIVGVPEQTKRYFRLNAVNLLNVHKRYIELAGQGFSVMLKAEEFSDAESYEECEQQTANLGKALDLLYTMRGDETVSIPVPTPPPVDNEHVAEGCEKFTS